MKKLGILALALALAMIFTIPTGVYAAEAAETETLPDPGITPDSPFYFMDKWGKQISLTFTFNAKQKVHKALLYAEERLAEVEAMAQQNEVPAMERAANEYQHCLMTATRNMEEAIAKGADTSDQVTTKLSKHISYMYQHQYSHQRGDTECKDCQQIRQQIREMAQTCQEDAVEALASQNPEEALRLGVRLMEQACNRAQNMVGQADSEQIEEALQQCERFRAMNQEMIANCEQLGLGPEAQQMLQKATAAQEGVLNQIRNQSQISSGGSADAPVQNQVQEQQRWSTTTGGTEGTQSRSGPMGPATNSGDGISDGSGLESPNGPNANN